MTQTSLARVADIPRGLLGLVALAVVAPVAWVVATATWARASHAAGPQVARSDAGWPAPETR